jgi:predicted ribonuclease YlaK
VKTTAIEPRVADSLPWLDPSNRDDRIIASLVEAVRQHPRSPVVLVTRDVNLQNKAAFAGLPFVEPPEPAT